ncbi:STM3941 family protein [Actinomyces wuliandei]|uniref:STM3941 family protein n=1 Tax=Actinomyces wuliandei TaxID=2057743 RepID=UPI00111AEB2F|nr:STM3941 family protein [Actinomyces wuliandei]
MEPLVIKHKSSYILPRVAGSLVLVIASIVVLAIEPPRVLVAMLGSGSARLTCVAVGLLGIVFFSYTAVRTARLGRGHALRVDDAGIDNRTNAVCVRRVPWEQVAGFRPLRVRMGIQDIDSVQIDFVDPQWPRTQISGLKAATVRANEGMAGFGPGSISTDPLGVTSEELHARLCEELRRRRPDPR